MTLIPISKKVSQNILSDLDYHAISAQNRFFVYNNIMIYRLIQIEDTRYNSDPLDTYCTAERYPFFKYI